MLAHLSHLASGWQFSVIPVAVQVASDWRTNRQLMWWWSTLLPGIPASWGEKQTEPSIATGGRVTRQPLPQCSSSSSQELGRYHLLLLPPSTHHIRTAIWWLQAEEGTFTLLIPAVNDMMECTPTGGVVSCYGNKLWNNCVDFILIVYQCTVRCVTLGLVARHNTTNKLLWFHNRI